jgi:hypothetical protein
MLTVYDDVDVLALDPAADEALALAAGAVDAEPEVDATDGPCACAVL